MSVYFCNKEVVDMDAITIMGVSVKTSENPVGFLGTGFKYGVSTLLRNGQKFELVRDGVVHSFGVVAKEIRGEPFDVVTLDGVSMGFTTKLGCQWEVWQAYREMHSNCLDEDGFISNCAPSGDWGTIIKIDGDLIEDCYHKRSEIFLDTEPIHEYSGCDIHPNASPYKFYRGIRVRKFERPAVYGYNVKYPMVLTEDRTLDSDYAYDREVSESVAHLEDKDILTKILVPPMESYEAYLSFSTIIGEPSDLFKEVVSENKEKATLNESALAYCNKYSDRKRNYKQSTTNELQTEELIEALELLHELECHMTREDFYVVENLGPNVYGMVRDNSILIDKKVLDKGIRFIASTLYEEWLHKMHGYRDESRELQSMLFEKLLFFVDSNKRSRKG